MSLRYRLFAVLEARLPASWQRWLGGSSLLRPLRDRFLRPGGRAALHRGPIEFEGHRFLFSAPFRVFRRAARRGVEARLSRLVLARGRAGGVMMDVGANCGFLTLMMAFAGAPDGRVVSIEPTPEALEALRRNVDDNGLCARVTVVAARAGAHEDDAVRTDGRQVTVDGLMDELAERAAEEAEDAPRLDLLKVDVDGGDLDVLRGAAETLRRDRPIVLVELERDARAIHDFLVDCGYRDLRDMELAPVDASRGAWPPNLIALPDAGHSDAATA
ncbi:MAG: FkbM family methyltransferase [Acidobacteriota bacterium]